jgi:ABC-type dipeptide/oligopeptide/nickel transport system permease subunit
MSQPETAASTLPPALVAPEPGRLRSWWRTRPTLVVGLVLLAGLVVMTIGAGVLSPYGVAETDPAMRLAGPSSAHLLGTDEFGRDLLTRVMHGARITLVVSVSAVLLGGAIGLLIGMSAGIIGGVYDAVMSRIIDAIFAFPFVFLAIMIVAVAGPGTKGATLALAVTAVPQVARVSRSAVVAEKALEYVEASRALGSSRLYIVVRGMVPNMGATLAALLTTTLAYTVLYEAALSFLGMGAQPPQPSWGLMLSTSRQYLFETPWYALFPGLAIFATVFAFNLIGEAFERAASRER